MNTFKNKLEIKITEYIFHMSLQKYDIISAGKKALLSVIFLLLHNIQRRIYHLFFGVFQSFAAACTLMRPMYSIAGVIHFSGKEKRVEKCIILSLLPSSNIEKIPCPIFITSEILLLAARCAETPDDSIYSLRVFNRLREI